MSQTMPSPCIEGLRSADLFDRPRLSCRCGHSELWHWRPCKPPSQTGELEQLGTPKRSLIASASSPWMGRALPTDENSRARTATVCEGRLVFSQAGASTLQSSASAPDLGP